MFIWLAGLAAEIAGWINLGSALEMRSERLDHRPGIWHPRFQNEPENCRLREVFIRAAREAMPDDPDHRAPAGRRPRRRHRAGADSAHRAS